MNRSTVQTFNQIFKINHQDSLYLIFVPFQRKDSAVFINSMRRSCVVEAKRRSVFSDLSGVLKTLVATVCAGLTASQVNLLFCFVFVIKLIQHAKLTVTVQARSSSNTHATVTTVVRLCDTPFQIIWGKKRDRILHVAVPHLWFFILTYFRAKYFFP